MDTGGSCRKLWLILPRRNPTGALPQGIPERIPGLEDLLALEFLVEAHRLGFGEAELATIFCG